MKLSELTGSAKAYYDDWRQLGLSEAQALEEVERSGIAVEQQLEEIFKRCGMDERAAHLAAQGRDGGVRAAHPFDQAVRRYQGMGMSPEAAKTAAIGRDMTETQARRLYAEAARPEAKTPLAQPVVETTKMPSVPTPVNLAEAKRSVVPLSESVPQIVARTEALVQSGLTEAAARRQAFREIYGREPRGVRG